MVGCRPPTDRPCTRPCYNNLVEVPIVRLPDRRQKKVALINDMSQRNKTLLVRDYIDDSSVDIVAVTKTWLADEDNASVSELYRDNFTLPTNHVAAFVAEEAPEFFSVNHSNSCHVSVLTCAHPKRFL